MLEKFLKLPWFSILSCIIVIGCIISAECKYAKFPNEVEANLVHTYNPNDDREVVGYGYHGRVYDKPASLYIYNTYEYVVDGTIYTYKTASVLGAKPVLKLRYADDPANVIVDTRN